MVSLNLYATGSALVSSLMIANAFAEHGQYFPSTLHLMTSKPSQVVLCNMAVVVFVMFGRLVKAVFLGRLRAIEVEHLHERARLTVFSTCLAMTFFRSEFGMRFMAYFTVLLFFKCFHWLSQDRVELVEQAQITTPSVHVRQISLILLLAVADLIAMYTCATRIAEHGVSMLLLFLFEYTQLFADVVTTMLKYAMTLRDISLDGRWDNKGLYMFYLDLVSDFLHMAVQFFFFATIMAFYGLPLHMIHQMYMTFRSFRRRVLDFYQYRRATGSMSTRYPEATPAELAAHDPTCIICRDEMTSARKLPCGHLFHFRCLRSWLQQQQTCPTCRRSVLDDPPAAAAAAAAPAAPGVPAAAAAPAPAPAPAPAAGPARPVPHAHAHAGAMPRVPSTGAPVDWQLAMLQQQQALVQAMIAQTAAAAATQGPSSPPPAPPVPAMPLPPQSPSAGNATLAQMPLSPEQQTLLAMQLQMQQMQMHAMMAMYGLQHQAGAGFQGAFGSPAQQAYMMPPPHMMHAVYGTPPPPVPHLAQPPVGGAAARAAHAPYRVMQPASVPQASAKSPTTTTTTTTTTDSSSSAETDPSDLPASMAASPLFASTPEASEDENSDAAFGPAVYPSATVATAEAESGRSSGAEPAFVLRRRAAAEQAQQQSEEH